MASPSMVGFKAIITSNCSFFAQRASKEAILISSGLIPSIGEIKLAVVNTKPLGPVKITENTQIEMETKPVDPSKFEGVENLIDVSYEDIGGLKNEVKKIFSK